MLLKQVLIFFRKYHYIINLAVEFLENKNLKTDPTKFSVHRKKSTPTCISNQQIISSSFFQAEVKWSQQCQVIWVNQTQNPKQNVLYLHVGNQIRGVRISEVELCKDFYEKVCLYIGKIQH
eukprot:TRINITY_DN13111_c0_g1_i2.p3 TRINITY_DN13111_c0_g1~~TRINITY_DN13111_c0_g1_i2.p3  ORF type:complete len:121 (-),score=1.42 TRINITY_DN13111_c0_g1_i2:264-626(-)